MRRAAAPTVLAAALLAALPACGARTAPESPDVDASVPAVVRPPARCGDIEDLLDCVTTAGCRWVTSGCGAPELPTACVPRGDCTTDVDCEEGLRCRQSDLCAGTPCTICAPGLTRIVRLCAP